MKRLLLSFATLLALPGCGLYTNVPAQIHVETVTPASLTFGKPDSTGYQDVQIVPGSVTIMGEPGSIGATFENEDVSYLSASTAISGSSVLSSSQIPPAHLRQTIRVESSNWPSDPLTTNLDQSAQGKSVHLGQTTVSLPVVTRYVQNYGSLRSANVGDLTAQVTISGYDDAGWPISLTIYMPISFEGAPNASS